MIDDEEVQSYESLNNILILKITSGIVALLFLIVFVLCFLKRKGFICGKRKDVREESIVHQNELYGNVTNQDYFDERYDTNIVDKNQYYDQEYEA